MTYDSATWLAFALVLTALGGVLTWLSWQRRGLASAVRGLAWTVLPMAAWMTGTLRLVVEIASDVGRWATHLVFSPVVWMGIILAGVAVVLFGASSMMRARGLGARERAGRGEVPAAPRGRNLPASRPARGGGTPAAGDDDMDDIEAILKKHGI